MTEEQFNHYMAFYDGVPAYYLKLQMGDVMTFDLLKDVKEILIKKITEAEYEIGVRRLKEGRSIIYGINGFDCYG